MLVIGLAPMEMASDEFMSVIYSMLVDEMKGPEMSRQESRDLVDKTLSEMIEPVNSEDGVIVNGHNRETWGLLPEHQQGQDRAFGLLTGAFDE